MQLISLCVILFLRQVLRTHLDHGYNFAVYHKGEKVVDLYGGMAKSKSLSFCQKYSKQREKSRLWVTKIFLSIKWQIEISRAFMSVFSQTRTTEYSPQQKHF